MSEQQQHIMIVDDNADNRELLEDIFEDDYRITSVSKGQACLDACSVAAPDIILLDVNMPVMDGYQVCKLLKGNVDTALIPVVFVSALVSIEERLHGFEVGAEDYVTKPFGDENIIEIVIKNLERRQKTLDFERQSKEAMSTAFHAMTNSADLGQIVQFLKQSFTYKSPRSLATGLMDTTAKFGLRCCMLVRCGFVSELVGCEKNSLEARVLERSYKGERFIDFGARTLVNDKHVCLLVKNMPLDKPDDYGRIKDHLVSLIAGAEARAQSIEVEQMLEHERQGGLQSVILDSREELKEIRVLMESQTNEAQRIIYGLSGSLEKITFSLGLSEDQEREITEELGRGVDEISELATYGARIAQTFDNFVTKLDELVKRDI
ncbi:MAG: hypothetical protein COA42_04345 [Alteromonadaceae bacterium]|nr:MAG: hypothetical protein COA42_04345 [Alteromonadaceae bacterium]